MAIGIQEMVKTLKAASGLWPEESPEWQATIAERRAVDEQVRALLPTLGISPDHDKDLETLRCFIRLQERIERLERATGVTLDGTD